MKNIKITYLSRAKFRRVVLLNILKYEDKLVCVRPSTYQAFGYRVRLEAARNLLMRIDGNQEISAHVVAALCGKGCRLR